MKILVINAGSSSLKYQLFDMDTEEVMAKGLCERIGIDGKLTHKPLCNGKPVYSENIPMPTHAEAIAAVLKVLVSDEYGVIASMSEIDAVGHRVLHGGRKFACSAKVDDECIKAIEECIPFGPLHNPANLTGINACREVMGDAVPQVAVFDTAFGMSLPEKAYMYAIPYEYYEQDEIRKYGFHGTSHRYVSRRVAEVMGKPMEELKIITCHLGNGSSCAAIMNGQCVETSMGFTPLVGLPMGTRSGDIDPGAMQFIMNKHNLSIDEMLSILNKKSGVLAVSGVSSDFRDLSAAAAEGNKRAQLALDMFHYWVAKVVGSYTAAMNGVDVIAFTAGVGENGCDTREEVCKYLGFLGITIDNEANSKRGSEIMISSPDSKVKVYVIPTNEELVIARDTKDIVCG